MASLTHTTLADISRLQGTVRTDREAARAEISARLSVPNIAPLLRQELMLLDTTAHFEGGDMVQALTSGRALVAEIENPTESLIAGRTQNLMGLMHWRMGDLPQALNLFTAAQLCGERIPDPKLAMQATGNMSLIHAAQKQWDEAIRGFRLTVAAAENMRDDRTLSVMANNLSIMIWERDGPTDEALAMARRALEAKLPLRDWVSIAQTANSIVGLHCDRSEYPEAHRALDSATDWVGQANSVSPTFYYTLNRAKLLAAIDNPQRDDDAAFAGFAEAISLAHNAKMVEPEARAHEKCAEAHAARGQYAEAYAHYQRYTQLQEKYLADESAQRVEKLRHSLQLERLESDRQAEHKRRVALETLNEQLTRTGRERDSLLRLIGHDLRTHVGGMIGLGEIIHDTLAPDHEARANTADLISIGESTLELLTEILEHGSALQGAFAQQDEFELVACMHETTRRVQPLFAAKGQSLEFDAPDEAVPIRSNRSGLGRIVENLLTNASKFSPSGTTTNLRLTATAGAWQILIIDRGQGIPEHEIPRLFHPEKRLSVRPTGTESSTGLGLIIAHDIARIIGVKLHHEPTPGGGATFAIISAERIDLGSDRRDR